MAAASWFEFQRWSHFSQPVSERIVYQSIACLRPKRLLELGLSSLPATERMIRVAARFTDPAQLRYTGIDRFEDAPEDPDPIRLKTAHRTLRTLGVSIRLLPGQTGPVVARTANELGKVDLCVVRCGHEPAEFSRAWFYLPRLLTDRSLVLYQNQGGQFQRLSPFEVAERAAQNAGRRRAA